MIFLFYSYLIIKSGMTKESRGDFELLDSRSLKNELDNLILMIDVHLKPHSKPTAELAQLDSNFKSRKQSLLNKNQPNSRVIDKHWLQICNNIVNSKRFYFQQQKTCLKSSSCLEIPSWRFQVGILCVCCFKWMLCLIFH